MDERDRRESLSLRLFAPAKLNLGLEVLGRRPSGYHDIVTILQAVTIFDVIDLVASEHVELETNAGPQTDDNLAIRATRAILATHEAWPYRHVRIAKQIPEAAGLGGGSSDAGTILGAAVGRGLISYADAVSAAASLGSDVPFFVRGGTALATGTGTTIEPLRAARRTWYVVVATAVTIPDKTRAMYAALRQEDFSDGSSTLAQSERLRRGDGLDPSLLISTFTRVLRDFRPVARALDALRAAGAITALPTGAGPAVYSPCRSFPEASRISARLPETIGAVLICTDARTDSSAGRT